MNKLLNDALRAKGYAGPDIKMVLTDVTDPNGKKLAESIPMERREYHMKVLIGIRELWKYMIQ